MDAPQENDQQPAQAEGPSDGAGERMIPALIGIGGWVTDERFALPAGETINIGRSRSSDISLRRIAAYTAADPKTRDDDHDFNTVSRRHATFAVEGNAVTITDVSTNGTFIDGEAIDDPHTIELTAESNVEVRLGTRETFVLSLVAPESLPEQAHSTADADAVDESEDGAESVAGSRIDTTLQQPDDESERKPERQG